MSESYVQELYMLDNIYESRVHGIMYAKRDFVHAD